MPSVPSRGICKDLEPVPKREEAAARQVFTQVILPVNRLAGQGAGIFYTVHKEILRRRGVIRTAKVRSPRRRWMKTLAGSWIF